MFFDSPNSVSPVAARSAAASSAARPETPLARLRRNGRAAWLLALAACGQAGAATWCISTGDQLAQALNGPDSGGAFASFNGEDDEIRLRTGRMTTLAGAVQGVSWVYDYARDPDSALTISGGWNSSCTSQTADPTLTVLDGRNASQVLAIDDRRFGWNGILSGDITVSNLTIANGRTFALRPISGEVAALNIEINAATALASVVVENVIITTSSAAAAAGNSDLVNISLNQGGFIRFRNNVIHANNLGAASNTTNLTINASSNAVAFINNNSIFGNIMSSAAVGLNARGVVSLANNVIAENSSSVLPAGSIDQLSALDGSGLSLRNNHITSMSFGGGTQPAQNVGTTTGPALWSGSGPFRIPDVGSPLRDSGTNSPTGGLASVDVRGLTRVVNTIVDRGAVEAQPAANTGPTVIALSPDSGSTTTLPATDGPTRTTRIFFITQSGTGSGRSTMDCRVSAGNGVVIASAVQQISNGGIPLPVDVALDNPVAGGGNVQATVVCDVYRENANSFTLTYFFVVTDPLLFRNGFE